MKIPKGNSVPRTGDIISGDRAIFRKFWGLFFQVYLARDNKSPEHKKYQTKMVFGGGGGDGGGGALGPAPYSPSVAF